MKTNEYYVSILSNKSGNLYVGITNDLQRRMYEHKNKMITGFTSKYNINRLIFFQSFSNPDDAIIAEKRIKGWKRERKIELIKTLNPKMIDLSDDWLESKNSNVL